jgi:hypothetical protein
MSVAGVEAGTDLSMEVSFYNGHSSQPVKNNTIIKYKSQLNRGIATNGILVVCGAIWYTARTY